MSHNTGLVMHIDNDLDLQRRRELENTIERQTGVSSAHFNERRPHLMVIDYDSDLVSSSEILHRINSNNLQAARIS